MEDLNELRQQIKELPDFEVRGQEAMFRVGELPMFKVPESLLTRGRIYQFALQRELCQRGLIAISLKRALDIQLARYLDDRGIDPGFLFQEEGGNR
jgi:hypothetical protein